MPASSETFAPPKSGDWGVYGCRGHWHLGWIWEGFDWDGDPDHGKELDWEEAGFATTFEKASERFVQKMIQQHAVGVNHG